MKLIVCLLLVTCGVLLSSCGPISGQRIKASEGLKQYEVVSGDISKLRGVKNLLVFGPFIGTGEQKQTCISGEDCLYPYRRDLKFVTKYNDAQRFAEGLKKAGLFNTELYLQVHYDKAEETVSRLKTMNSREIQAELNLRQSPETILFGMVSKRDLEVAPLRGVVVDVVYRLEFYDPDSRQSTLLDVAVKGLFEEDLKTVISELKTRTAMKN